MMKKTVFIVATVFALMVVLCVPCFAAETTSVPSDPVDWFGGSTVGGYSYTIDSYSKWPYQSANAATVSRSFSYSGVDFAPGDTVYMDYDSSVPTIFKNGTSTYQSASESNLTAYFTQSTYTAYNSVTMTGTPYTVGSNGFVDSGVSDALTELSLIVSAILSNQYILIAIGLAVAVPLVAWGISKIKSLVKGY